MPSFFAESVRRDLLDLRNVLPRSPAEARLAAPEEVGREIDGVMAGEVEEMAGAHGVLVLPPGAAVHHGVKAAGQKSIAAETLRSVVAPWSPLRLFSSCAMESDRL